MITLYLVVIATALYWVSKILLPEMLKPPVIKTVPKTKSPNPPQIDEPVNRVERLEKLLAEKNKNIQILQTELQAFNSQIRDFDKIKTLLEEEIHRLKEQNHIFRSELGLPANQTKETSTV